MAGRFVFQKHTSGIGMSRSVSRLASASSRATAPVNRAWGARYLNTRTQRQPSVFKHKKSAVVDSFGEGKPTACSPDASNKLKLEDGLTRLALWAFEKYDGLHPHDVFWLQYSLCGGLLAYSLVMACTVDVNVSSMAPS